MNLVEGIQKQQERVRAMIPHYEAIGPAGAFGIAMLKAAIEQGNRSIASGNVIEMLAAYQKLESCEE